MEQMTFAFLGLGLIGGSIAKAVRQYYPDCEITAFDKSKETLALALQENVITASCSTIDDSFRGCDFVFLCTPVSYNNAYLKQICRYLDENTLLTDVGSVKTSIHEEVKALGLDRQFIGGHPMAGSEKSGYSNSKAFLIENAYYVITPSDTVPEERIQTFQELILSLRAIPIRLNYRQHDQITGMISHLPHIIASGLVNFVKEQDDSNQLMKMLAAGGFKDITRIASSSPTMWEHICLLNQEYISEILSEYIASLEKIKALVDTSDADRLHSFFAEAREYRNSMPEISAGPIKKSFSIYCDLIDEAGGIAAIATILSASGISIKNIGILHNREFEDGVLHIEFYDEAASDHAAALLEKYHYIIYRR